MLGGLREGGAEWKSRRVSMAVSRRLACFAMSKNSISNKIICDHNFQLSDVQDVRSWKESQLPDRLVDVWFAQETSYP
jgi:hypothetical protein